MKKLKVLIILLSVLLTSAAGTLIGISIWANKSRGIRIDLDQLKY